MTKAEERIIRKAISRLNGDTAAADIKAMLNSERMRIYLTYWVIPQLEALLPENRNTLDAEYYLDEARKGHPV